MKILLFIPAYNCEKQIPRVLKKIQEMDASLFHEIYMIDNQSKDNTLKEALSYKINSNFSNLKIVSNGINIGLGGTHKMAFQYAIDNHFDGCLIIHGDDQGNIQEVPFHLLVNNNFFLGSRFKFKSNLINYSLIRIAGNLAFNSLASLICLKLISDFGGSGLNYFPTNKLKDHKFWNYPDDLTFHAYLLLNIIKMKQSFHYFPVTWSETDQISNVKLVSQTIKYFKILFKYFSNKNLTDEQCKANSKDYISWVDYN
jgi:glycosyltransferase involved in cell wall biosynthesis